MRCTLLAHLALKRARLSLLHLVYTRNLLVSTFAMDPNTKAFSF